MKPFAPSLVLVCFLSVAARAEPAKEIVVGASLPLTGSEARAGTFLREGYELAFDQAMRAGGLLVGGVRRPVRLRLLDDGNDSKKGAELTQKLLEQERVDLLLGSYSGGVVDAQSAVAEKARVPYVTSGGAAPSIYRNGRRFLFSVLAPIDRLSAALMRWIDEEQAAGRLPTPMRLAIAAENSLHGKEFAGGIREFVAKANARRNYSYRIVLDDSFELEAKDFRPLLNHVATADADALLIDAHLSEFIGMHKQYVAAGLCHKVLSYGARGSEKQAAEALPPGSTDYILSSIWWNSQLGSKGVAKEFVDAFQKKYGRLPDWYQALSYEATRALFAAVEAAGTLDGDAVRQKLAEMKIESLLPGGLLRFPAEYGQQAQYLFVIQQNLPGAGSPIVYPKIAATHEGIAANPRCAPRTAGHAVIESR
jgi:branched-chain amino acid transport system substrate-binding protein